MGCAAARSAQETSGIYDTRAMSVPIDIFERMFDPEGMPATLLDTAAPVADEVQRLKARIRQMQAPKLDSRTLPTHPAFADLLPGGALLEGGAYSVAPSSALVMALLSGPSAAGSWCGVVGMPEFGVEAAQQFGVDLDRLVLVPEPGEQWLSVTAAIADVLTVVVTRPASRASDSAVARLAARLRQRGATLLVLGAWPQADAMISLSDSSWSGVGDGHGYLDRHEVTVTVSSRQSPVPRSARMLLPGPEQQVRALGPVRAPRVRAVG
ncbi:hypothetical protein CLV46_1741 [Diaminobutyricimonas aerilata]|uniref:Protein ImuA n=2 Tax=Diaminobutyricimonas aerilata TaxID=1162967 RepID=A0A2M9CJV5_9MICO|nr:hypothetical protein CLV46_1741 [Diaminobutyricimonas aerilata]